jgi:hypothetical protein
MSRISNLGGRACCAFAPRLLASNRPRPISVDLVLVATSLARPCYGTQSSSDGGHRYCCRLLVSVSGVVTRLAFIVVFIVGVDHRLAFVVVVL